MELAEEVFQEIVLDHSRRPRNAGRLVTPPAWHGRSENPACGDEVELWLRCNPEGRRIEEIVFTGQGCAISQASASLLTVALRGQDLEQAMNFRQQFMAMLQGEHDGEGLGQLQYLSKARNFPARVACAQVAWDALSKALRSA